MSKNGDKTAKLDIVVTHYREPWDLGKKFFAMLDLQRGIDFDDIRVILIHDGTEMFPAKYFSDRPYRVEQHTIEHGGISAARNEGIRLATAEWIAFCDFDDMYSNVYALRDYLTLIPNDRFDMMWAPFLAEDMTKEGQLILNERKQNMVFVHGKVYRRQYLIDQDLWFDTALEFNEDSAFNAILNTIGDWKRIGEIKPPMIPYVWAFNPNSLTTTRANKFKALTGLYYRNMRVVDVFKKKMPYDRYCAMVARCCVDAYYMLNLTEIPEEIKPLYDDFVKFYHEHKNDMWNTDAETLRKVKNISRLEHETGVKEELQRFGNLEVNIPPTELTVTQWLQKIWDEGEPNDIRIETGTGGEEQCKA